MTKYISPNDKNQKGFSLVEVLIAIGILSIFVSGIITLFLNSNKAQKGLEQKNEALILSQQIQSILSSSKGGGDTKCSLLLGIKNLPISPAPIMSINIGGVSYQQGQNYIKESGLFFKQLNLLNIENSGTEVKDGIQTIKYRAEITYQMSKNASGKQISSGVSEFRPVSIPILIFVQASNGLIYDCTSIDKGYNSALCSDEFDGIHSEIGAPKCSLKSMSFADVAGSSITSSTNYRVKIQDSLVLFSDSTPSLYFSRSSSSTIYDPLSSNVSIVSSPSVGRLLIKPQGSDSANISIATNLTTFSMTSEFLQNINVNGNLWSGGTVTAASDNRLKTNVEALTSNLKRVLDMEPIRFQYLRSSGTNNFDIGFSAQSMRKILPEVVKESDSGYLAIAYGNITAVLVGAIQELNYKLNLQDKRQDEMIEKLQHQIDQLKSEIKKCQK